MSTVYFGQLRTAYENGIFVSFIKESAASGELFTMIPSLKGLDQVDQDPRWHPEGNVWTHTLLVIENLPPTATFAMALSALLHDVGKAYTTQIYESGRITAYGHEGVSKKIANIVLDDLGADSKIKQDVLFLIAHHMVAHGKHTTIKTLRRLILEAGVDLVNQLLLHGVADVKSGSGDFTDCIRLRALFDNIAK